MAIENFKPEVFSTTCLTARDEKTVALPLCDRSFEGNFKLGTRVHIPGVGSPTTHVLPSSGLFVDESGTAINPEDIEDEGSEFTIDQAKFILFHTNELDELQRNQDAANRFMQNNSNNMVKEQDGYIYGLAKAGAGLSATGTAMTSQNAYGIICDALAALYTAHSSLTASDISIEVHPYVANVIGKALQYHGTPNDLKNGGTGLVVNGVNILQSNNTIITDASGTVLSTPPKFTDAAFHTDIFHGVIRTKRAIVFAEPKSMSWDSGDMGKDGIGTYVKGWYYYGGKVLYPDEVVDVTFTLGTETNV
jgi:hypothetical protein